MTARLPFFHLLAGVTAAVLLVPSSSLAAGLGALTQLAGPAGCVTKLGAVDGCTEGGPALDGLLNVEASPDGRHVYATTGPGAVVLFDRHPRTGALTQTGCVADPAAALPCVGVPALAGAVDLAVSPDGRNVYVAAFQANAVVVLRRDPASGALTSLGCISTIHPACDVGLALDGAGSVAVSPDGRTVYVGAFLDGAVAAFARDPTTGLLTQLPGLDACVSYDGTFGVCDQAPGLRGVVDLAVGPEGNAVYAVGFFDDALVGFARTSTGALTGAHCLQGTTPLAPACGLAPGLLVPSSLAVSPDGRNLYVASIGGGLVLFQRDPGTGAISQLPGRLGCISETLTVCQPGAALGGAESVAISPDGRSVYVSGNALAVFTRDPATGALAQLAGEDGCISQTLVGCARARAFDNPLRASVSPDGQHVYVAAGPNDAVTAFDRTGADEAGPVVGIVSRVIRAPAGRIIQLRLSCPQEAVVCHGTISLTVNGGVVGRGGFAVVGGTTGPAETRLSKRGRALLARHGRLATTVTVVARDAQGLGRTTTGTVTILAPSAPRGAGQRRARRPSGAARGSPPGPAS